MGQTLSKHWHAAIVVMKVTKAKVVGGPRTSQYATFLMQNIKACDEHQLDKHESSVYEVLTPSWVQIAYRREQLPPRGSPESGGGSTEVLVAQSHLTLCNSMD